jgi:hypothetical protein
VVAAAAALRANAAGAAAKTGQAAAQMNLPAAQTAGKALLGQ